MFVCLCVCHVSHLCSSPAYRLVFVTPKSYQSLALRGQFIWLNRGLSKNAVHQNAQLDQTKILVSSNYFRQSFFCPKTCKTFLLIFKTLENFKYLRIVSKSTKVFGKQGYGAETLLLGRSPPKPSAGSRKRGAFGILMPPFPKNW